ncbi:transcription antitermination factor NusB [Aquabacterium lacunae]|uniref:Transcription antitermination protein NusB n=1 Tax=Aquabacterium lacunae TaxID=2528630 RepID=A0A4Q9GXX2_9BURK|nr:transcription antitermination factor NusB [Aquabacterium lacunae]TBO30473.1 transcription antitermination factor NusB [Aquabacterium lacunae]
MLRDRTKSARRRAREFALQGLYEWQLNPRDTSAIEAHVREQDEFHKCDRVHFDALLHGCVAQRESLDAQLVKFLDRPLDELSPIEHAVLWVGTYELAHCMDVPYKVAINEAVELAKSFGGTDGHKYVNGVLDHLAPLLRAEEVKAQRQR